MMVYVEIDLDNKVTREYYEDVSGERGKMGYNWGMNLRNGLRYRV